MVDRKMCCTLCGQPLAARIEGQDGAVYCCHACKEVAILLAESPEPPSTSPEPGNSAQVTFNLGGMWCASCGWLIEERLKRTAGVSAAAVSFLERKARIDFDGTRTTERKIRRKIRSLGYQADATGSPQEEEDRFFTRLLVGGLLAMHIMVVSLIIYARDWLGLSSPDSAWLEQFFYTMQFVLSIPLALLLGLPILRAGAAGLLRGMPNVQSLVALGAAAALGLSARNLFSQAGHVYFDTAAMLFFLLTIGRWLEMKAHLAGQTAFEALADALPRTARLLTPEGEKLVPIETLKRGQRIRVLAGETVPADGMIAAGTGEIDESLLKGEPAPVVRTVNSHAFAGTITIDGAFELIITQAGADSRLGQIQTLLEGLLWERSPAEKLADRLAARLVYAALAIAALTFTGYALTSGPETALLNSLSVLLIACPCALGIATPLTLWQAIGRASENGLLLRSSTVLEKLGEVQNVYFDKTGTLTDLQYQVRAFHTLPEAEADFIHYIGALEARSVHPIGKAVSGAFNSKLPGQLEVEDFQTIPGAGVIGKVCGKTVFAGSGRLLKENGLTIPLDLKRKAERGQAAGAIAVFGGWDGAARGLVLIGERLRDEAMSVFAELRALELDPQILTGDTVESGMRWEQKLGIPVHAGLLPEEKLDRIRLSPGALMVGDGINDGPALAAASVGIAMVHGTDAAQSAAEITLMDDDLRAVPWLFRLARETRHRLRQNLVWAGVYNVLGIALAAAGLLQPVLAALAMVVSSTLVTRNALRLRAFPSWKQREGAPDPGAAPRHVSTNNTTTETMETHEQRLSAAPPASQT